MHDVQATTMTVAIRGAVRNVLGDPTVDELRFTRHVVDEHAATIVRSRVSGDLTLRNDRR